MKSIFSFITIFSFSFFSAQLWIPQGVDIDGEAAGDWSGYSVSMNSAGDIVAIGAPFNYGNGSDAGLVRIYAWNGTSWTQQGQDIDGEAADDWSGYSISMNDVGDRIIVGAIKNDGNGANSGHARVFDWNGTSWTQLGQDIDGETAGDESGYFVSMNAAGDRVAIGAPENEGDGIGVNNTVADHKGHVRIYSWDGISWNQLGADIDGEWNNDMSGECISMNASGSRIAIGSYQNGGYYGHVRIYEYRYVSYAEFINSNWNNFFQSSGQTDPIVVGAHNGWNTDPNNMYWIQLGADIQGLSTSNSGVVAINASGDRVAIGGPTGYGGSGHVRVFDWNGSSWTQTGADILGEATDDRFGSSISMNDVGDRIIVGAIKNDGNGANSGHARVFDWNGTSWIQQGQDIDGEAAYDESGNSVSMNAAGDRIVIGSNRNSGNGSNAGHARIFAFGNSNGCVVNTYVANNSPILSAINYSYASYQWLDCNNNYSIISGENNYEFNTTFNGNYAVEITYNNGCVDTSACYVVGNISDTCNTTIYDTLTTQIFDTLTTQVYDTLTTQVFDTLTTQVYDTVITQVYDTLTTQIFDTITTNITIYDTLTTYDTIYLSVTDTLYIDVNLSGIPSITNTIKVYPNPTADQVIIDNGNYTAMGSGGYIINILNSTGQQVFSSPVNQQTFTIDISQFGSNGLYYVQILNANLSVVEVKHIILH